jgi:hypothetical protein
MANDIYGFLVHKIVEKIDKLHETTLKFIRLNLLNITRKFIKRSIMGLRPVTITGIAV